MSYRVRDIQNVHNNSLNSSKSKQQYTIPRADRFRNAQSVVSYKYYDLPSTNQCRSTSFGIANRKGLFLTDKSIPPPGQYNPKEIQSKTQNISFAKGRNECKTSNFLKILDNPGPGAYNPNPQFVDSQPSSKYSMRAKTLTNFIPTQDIPGPGRYTIKTSWLQKQKILSKDKKCGAPLIRLSTEVSNQPLDIPFYNPKSNIFNRTGFSIGKSQRFNSRIKTQNPGPGTYNRFSQFI